MRSFSAVLVRRQVPGALPFQPSKCPKTLSSGTCTDDVHDVFVVTLEDQAANVTALRHLTALKGPISGENAQQASVLELS
jgi:hypothetical protein